jgi:hypothetical protein
MRVQRAAALFLFATLVAPALLSSADAFNPWGAPRVKPLWPGTQTQMRDIDDAKTLQDLIVLSSIRLGWDAPAPPHEMESLGLARSIGLLYETSGALAYLGEGATTVSDVPGLQEQIDRAASQLHPAVAAPLDCIVQAVALAARDQIDSFTTVPQEAMKDYWRWMFSDAGMSGKESIPLDILEAVGAHTQKHLQLRAALTVLDAKDKCIPLLESAYERGYWPSTLGLLEPQPTGGPNGPNPMLPDLPLPATPWPNPPAVWQDPLALIQLGTSGDDTYRREEGRWILIDPAGNDVYRNNAGGAMLGPDPNVLPNTWGESRVCLPNQPCKTLPPTLVTTADGRIIFMPTAIWNAVGLAVDMGKGNDQYIAEGWRGNGAQGGASGGIAYLEDQGGQNMYSAGSSSQGAGVLGVGFLNASGASATDNDRYFSWGPGSQGYGGLGVGVLVDWNGNDEHYPYQDAVGTSIGAGAGLYDDKDGSDKYSASSGNSGGFVGETQIPGPAFARFRDRGDDLDCYRGMPCNPASTSLRWKDSSEWTYAVISGYARGGGLDE